MDCNKARNLQACNCTYEPCPRKGLCCECVSYHRAAGQLPACFFPDDVERTYDRSYRRFAELVTGGRNGKA
jgi:hypothetical protein